MAWWKLFQHNWHTFWRLSPSYRWVFGQAIVLLPCIALGLHLLGFTLVKNLLARSSSQQQPRSARQGQVYTIARLVQAATTHGFWKANCLQRSLVLWWLLRRRGIMADLRIGVARDARQLTAHAWVEHDGVVVGDRPDIHQSFSPFDHPIA
ncbi:MAG: lasso peptide biosynthesis B2 protein [Cyanobacteria bacterium]|nr:lasso peptide biosynthesis B2 protein [Cyanobacteriota bacterium]MDW8199675.1 lasso peptide biosynthesis B2 protein [Cyanobacteriota bacterium SKYGB_h_bin112]